MSRFQQRESSSSRLRRLAWLCAISAALPVAAHAQYPGHVDPSQASNQPHLRATAVYEFTGDITKPNAGRLIPIAVWDGTAFQPGGLYLAQPAPLAVQAGTLYELEEAGQRKGLFDIKEAENQAGLWIGVGVFQKETPPQITKLRPSKHLPQVVQDYNPDKPHFAHRPADDSQTGGNSGGSSGGNSGSSSGSTTTTTAAKAPPVDPDRPTLHKRTDSGDSGSNTSSTSGSDSSSGSSSDSASGSSSDTASTTSAGGADVDPDRPTLHRRNDAGAGSAGGSGLARSEAPAVDPNRPRLGYGRPANMEAIDKPDALTGTPTNMEQVVAVSDPTPAEQHVFTYSWPDPDTMTKMKTALEAIALKALVPPAVAPKPAAKSTVHTGTTTAQTQTQTRTQARRRKAAAPAPPALSDEEFHAYELSYGGGATLVFSADLKAKDGSVKYVTLIAKPDFYGSPQVLLTHTTSDKELEFNPRMQLVDAVDTDGDHRAELIFELRSKNDRQFAIYRVAGGQAEQVFTTASLR